MEKIKYKCECNKVFDHYNKLSTHRDKCGVVKTKYIIQDEKLEKKKNDECEAGSSNSEDQINVKDILERIEIAAANVAFDTRLEMFEKELKRVLDGQSEYMEKHISKIYKIIRIMELKIKETDPNWDILTLLKKDIIKGKEKQ